MKFDRLKNEEGFFSSLILIFLVTLALMGMGSYALIRSEGVIIANQIQSVQAEYAGNSAVYYGLKRIQLGGLDESESIAVGGVSVTLDTTINGGPSDIRLIVNASVGSLVMTQQIDMGTFNIEDVAIWTTGDVSDVSVRDSTGTEDEDLIIQNADSLPSMNMASLQALSSSQGHDQTGAYIPPDGFPSSSFYYSGMTPNVTYINGDLIVEDGRLVYGIFIVTGNVEIHSSFLGGIGRIEGIVYLPNTSSSITMSMESATSVNGGVLSAGDIDGTGWMEGVIQHIPEYMKIFSQFRTNPNASGIPRILDWAYL